MKNIITTIITLICLQVHCQLAYEVLDIASLPDVVVIEHKYSNASFTKSNSEATGSVPHKELKWNNTTDLRNLAETGPVKYLSTISLGGNTTAKETVSNMKQLNPLSIMFYRTNEGAIFKFLKPIDLGVLNVPSSQQIPKGFGPTFKI